MVSNWSVMLANSTSISRIVLLSVLGTPRFSNDFSQTSQSFSASSAELRTFLLKNSVFLAAAYLQKCFLADFAGFFHLLLLCWCRWWKRFPHFPSECPQNPRVFFFSTPTPLVLLLGLKVYEVRNMFTPNPSWYDQDRWRCWWTYWWRNPWGWGWTQDLS